MFFGQYRRPFVMNFNKGMGVFLFQGQYNGLGWITVFYGVGQQILDHPPHPLQAPIPHDFLARLNLKSIAVDGRQLLAGFPRQMIQIKFLELQRHRLARADAVGVEQIADHPVDAIDIFNHAVHEGDVLVGIFLDTAESFARLLLRPKGDFADHA